MVDIGARQSSEPNRLHEIRCFVFAFFVLVLSPPTSSGKSIETLNPGKLQGSHVAYVHVAEIELFPPPTVTWNAEVELLVKTVADIDRPPNLRETDVVKRGKNLADLYKRVERENKGVEREQQDREKTKGQIRRLVLEPLTRISAAPIQSFVVTLPEPSEDNPITVSFITVPGNHCSMVVDLSSSPPWSDAEIAAAEVVRRDREAVLIKADLNHDGKIDRVAVLNTICHEYPAGLPVPYTIPVSSGSYFESIGVFFGTSDTPAWGIGGGDEGPPDAFVWSWEETGAALLKVSVPYSDAGTTHYLAIVSDGIRELIRWNTAYDCCASKVSLLSDDATIASLSSSEGLRDSTTSGEMAKSGDRSQGVKGARAMQFVFALESRPGTFRGDSPLEIPKLEVDDDIPGCTDDELRIVSFKFEPEKRELSVPSFGCEPQ